MTKKRSLGDLVGTETPKPKLEPPEDLGRTISVGVGLKTGEVAQLDEIAGALGVSRNAIMAWIIRHALAEIRSGELEIPVKTKQTRTLGEP